MILSVHLSVHLYVHPSIHPIHLSIRPSSLFPFLCTTPSRALFVSAIKSSGVVQHNQVVEPPLLSQTLAVILFFILSFLYSFGSLKQREFSWALLFDCSVSAGERAGMTPPWGWVLLIRGWILSQQLYMDDPLSDPCQHPSPMTWRDGLLGKRGRALCPSGCASTSCVMEHFLMLTPMPWKPGGG